MRRIIYIHDLPDWPDFRWDQAALSDSLAAVRNKQGRLLGRMDGLGFEAAQEAALASLTSEIVHSSAIEGETLDPQRVRSSIASRLGLDAAGLPPPDRSTDGIVQLMLDATQRFDQPLTAERLFNWHAALFPTGRSGIIQISVGAWRLDESAPMRVVSGHQQQRVHFEAPAAARLPHEMRRFLHWFDDPSPTDAVLRAAIAHLWFVTIHPFDDGNGRIARAIADMALARADGSRDRYYSMSTQIEREKNDYYTQLERQQRADTDITPWLSWFLGCLDRTISSAEATLAAVMFKARFWERINHHPLNPRQQSVINRMLGPFEGFMNTSKYATLARCSSDTALRDIHELLTRGILLKNDPRGRSTTYRLGTLDTLRP